MFFVGSSSAGTNRANPSAAETWLAAVAGFRLPMGLNHVKRTILANPRRQSRQISPGSYTKLMNVLLISTYELGHQPFGLASPAAWLRDRGHRVTALDLSRQELDELAVREASLIACFIPMHTAARLTLALVPGLRALNPSAELCVYGLYASLTEESFRQLGVRHFFGGEFEQPLAAFADSLASASPSNPPGIESSLRSRFDLSDVPAAPASVSLRRQKFLTPDRSGLPHLARYARVILPEGGHRVAGYTEASRGCKHLCRHCPIVPVYNGIFRIVDKETVLADVRQQVAAGAGHITFGDPDFFNGIGHALAIVRDLHAEFPELTYDVTIKIEHLRLYERHLPVLRDTNCLFVTSAVESLDDEVLAKLQKKHTRAGFLRVARNFRELGLTLQPTFVPFTPWTTLESYIDLLETLAELSLIENVPPIQLAIRLLVPAKSRLLELPDIQRIIDPFDEQLLVYPWRHSDSRMDVLAAEVESIAASAEKQKWSRRDSFEKIYELAVGAGALQRRSRQFPVAPALAKNAIAPGILRSGVPYLNEPWYC